MNESTTAESKKQDAQKPPLSVGRIAGEILAGAGVGFLAGLAGAVVRLVLFPIASTDCFGGNVIVTLSFTFLWVYGPASAVIVYLVGSTGKQTGSFLATLACGVLGGLGAIALLLSGMPVVAMEADLLISPILATLGFNFTRRYKEPGRVGANVMDEFTYVEQPKQVPQKPHLSRVRIVGEILAGTATGFAIELPVIVLYVVLVANKEKFDWFFRVLVAEGIIVCGFFTYGLASAVGVYLVGSRGKQTGSFQATLACGFLGGFVMLLMRPIVHAASRVLIVGVEQVVPWALWVLVSFIPPIFATLGFNLTRRYKEPRSS